jgi:hypothetical protein
LVRFIQFIIVCLENLSYLFALPLIKLFNKEEIIEQQPNLDLYQH